MALQWPCLRCCGWMPVGTRGHARSTQPCCWPEDFSDWMVTVIFRMCSALWTDVDLRAKPVGQPDLAVTRGGSDSQRGCEMFCWAGPCPGQQRGQGGASRGSVKCWGYFLAGRWLGAVEKKRAGSCSWWVWLQGTSCGQRALKRDVVHGTGSQRPLGWADSAGEELCRAVWLAQASLSLPQPPDFAPATLSHASSWEHRMCCEIADDSRLSFVLDFPGS